MMRLIRPFAAPVLLLGLMGTFHIQAASLVAPAVPAVATLEAGMPGEMASSSASRRKCTQCGVIMAVREMPGAALPAYGNGATGGARELTLRLADGSQRILIDTQPAAWRLGEKISIID